MFSKKVIFENWTSRGVKSSVTQFHTNRKQKKIVQGKLVYKCDLKFVEKWHNVSKN